MRKDIREWKKVINDGSIKLLTLEMKLKDLNKVTMFIDMEGINGCWGDSSPLKPDGKSIDIHEEG